MKNDNIDISLQDPQLPSAFKNARRNHGGMTIPENFFDTFEQRMNAAIDAEIEAKQPSIHIEPQKQSKFSRRWIASAAAVAVIAVLAVTLGFVRTGENLPTDDPTINGIANVEQTVTEEKEPQQEILIPEQVADEMMADASDVDVYEMYYDI